VGCPYCKNEVSTDDIFCPACDSQLYSPKDFLTMKDFSPIDSTLKWIELYRKGSYSLGKFQTRVKWLIEAVRIEKEQMEASVNPDALSESEAKTHQEFVQIMGLMLDALEKTDLHLREGEDELLKKSLVTIHDVHNKLHDLKDSMIQTFSKEELQKS